MSESSCCILLGIGMPPHIRVSAFAGNMVIMVVTLIACLWQPAAILAVDCNNNGIEDAIDIDPTDPDGNGDVSPDCNGNGVPDECDVSLMQLELNGNDTADGDAFGVSTSISGNSAIIGAVGSGDAGIGSGAAYVFIRSGSDWTQQARLTADDAASFDNFGNSVSISGDTAIVGARFDDDAGIDSGAAYVFVRSEGTWIQQSKLTAIDAAAGDYFGNTVAISGDTAIVGAPRHDGVGTWSGASYVFVRSDGAWMQQAKLTASDAAPFDSFGYSVSLSGDTAVVGADRDDDVCCDSGSAYVFVRSGESWSVQTKLKASDGAANNFFGLSVCISANTIVVGAQSNSEAGGNAGAAYAFVRSDDTWTQQAKIIPVDAASGDQFGNSVAVDGDTAVIGARLGNDPTIASAGSAYVFRQSAGMWLQSVKLTAEEPALQDYFGFAVAVSGNTAVIGARGFDNAGSHSGSAFFVDIPFELDTPMDCNSNGIPDGCEVMIEDCNNDNIPDDCQLFGNDCNDDNVPDDCQLIDIDCNNDGILDDCQFIDIDCNLNGIPDSCDVAIADCNDNGVPDECDLFPDSAKHTSSDAASFDNFGYSVAISGDTAIVGAWRDDDAGDSSGSAYVLIRSGGNWLQQAKLTANDGAAGDRFGAAVSISGDLAIIGAFMDDDAGSGSGSAYIFVRSGGIWSQQAKLVAENAIAGDGFGSAVFVCGHAAIVGAPAFGGAGAACVFRQINGTWTQQATLSADDTAPNDNFGNSVSINSNTAIVGAWGHDNEGHNHGAAYVFQLVDGSWTQQAKLTADDAQPNDEFGKSVALEGVTAVIGAIGDDDAGADSGSAYVFAQSDGAWSQQAKLSPDGAGAFEYLGASVSISGDMLIIGSRNEDDSESGTAYVFKRIDGIWTQLANLDSDDGALYDYFGVSVGICGNTAIVGAPFDDAIGLNSGSAYLFDFNNDCNGNGAPDDCESDLDNDGVIDGCDNCIDSANPTQADRNDDGIGDACQCRVYGDLNGDTAVNAADIHGFMNAALSTFDQCADLAPPAGVIDSADIASFVSLLLGGH